MSQQLRVLALTSDNLIGIGICTALNDDQFVEFIHVPASKLPQLPALYHRYTPCIVLFTTSPAAPAIQHSLMILQRLDPQLRAILVATTYERDDMTALLQLSASAFVLATDPPEALRAAVHAVGLGSSWFSSAAVKRFYGEQQTNLVHQQRANRLHQLTKREHEVLVLLSSGLNNEQIGEKLSVSERTVRFHTHNIYEKLEFQSRSEAISWAIHAGLSS